MSDPQSDEGVQLGKYRVIRRLASGGMGEVFLARVAGPAGFEKTLVLKRVLRRLQGEPRFIEMFLNEARVAAQLSHPNVVHIYELAELEGSYVIAMEYVEGLSLRALFTAVKGKLLTLSPSLAAYVCAQALHGLHYAHLLRDERGRVRGVVHRDVSPENILLGFNGAVKVADFGLARAAQAAVDLKPLGKVSYMAPEQRLGGLIDARADVYAMGVVLSEALTGEPLDGLSEVPRLPDPTLDGIVRRALSAHPDGRFLSAGEMAEALEAFARQSSDANTTRLGDLVRLAAVKLGPGEDAPGALTQLTVPAYLHGAQSSAPEAKSGDVVALSTPPPPPPTPPKPSRYEKQVRLTAELDAPAEAVKKPRAPAPLRWLALGGLGLGALLAVAVWLAGSPRPGAASREDAARGRGADVSTTAQSGTDAVTAPQRTSGTARADAVTTPRDTDATTPQGASGTARADAVTTPQAARGTDAATTPQGAPGTDVATTPQGARGTDAVKTPQGTSETARTDAATTPQGAPGTDAVKTPQGTSGPARGTNVAATPQGASGTARTGAETPHGASGTARTDAAKTPQGTSGPARPGATDRRQDAAAGPTKQSGRVQVRVHPWAEVLWGGKLLGTTPFPAFELPAGAQPLTLRNAELNVTRVVTVQVRAGEEVSVFENLLK